MSSCFALYSMYSFDLNFINDNDFLCFTTGDGDASLIFIQFSKKLQENLKRKTQAHH